MNLRRSNSISLAFDSVTTFFAFGDATKSSHADVLYSCGGLYPSSERGGLQPPAALDIGTRAQQSCVGVHFSVMPGFVQWRYCTKILFL
jgi:hypothetical protein